MSRRPLGSLNGALLGCLVLLGCGGGDAMRVGLYDPSTAYSSYGYGGASAGASAWSGYAGVAPSVAAPPPSSVPAAPSVALHVPRLQYGVVEPLEPGAFPSGPLRLSTPALHTRRSDGWHYH